MLIIKEEDKRYVIEVEQTRKSKRKKMEKISHSGMFVYK